MAAWGNSLSSCPLFAQFTKSQLFFGIAAGLMIQNKGFAEGGKSPDRAWN